MAIQGVYVRFRLLSGGCGLHRHSNELQDGLKWVRGFNNGASRNFKDFSDVPWHFKVFGDLKDLRRHLGEPQIGL